MTATAPTLCTMGMMPSLLNVLPAARCTAGPMAAASIMDNIPFVNIVPFGLCRSLANPAVAAATAAALGVLTPMPCTPVIPGPWVPGSPTVLVGGKPALTNASKCLCAYGGVISITFPGQVTVMAP